jgi:hypothetical protein
MKERHKYLGLCEVGEARITSGGNRVCRLPLRRPVSAHIVTRQPILGAGREDGGCVLKNIFDLILTYFTVLLVSNYER